jgi:hypothetical protein
VGRQAGGEHEGLLPLMLLAVSAKARLKLCLRLYGYPCGFPSNQTACPPTYPTARPPPTSARSADST